MLRAHLTQNPSNRVSRTYSGALDIGTHPPIAFAETNRTCEFAGDRGNLLFDHSYPSHVIELPGGVQLVAKFHQTFAIGTLGGLIQMGSQVAS